MTTVYERAGLTPAEIAHLTDLVAAAESVDRTTRWIAVDRLDVLSVVAVLDRIISTLPGQTFVPAVPIADEAAWLRAVGLRVRLARIARGETQADVSSRTGISRVTVGDIERGDHPAAVTSYVSLAEALGMPITRLLTGSP